MAYLVRVYGVSDENAREQLFEKINALILDKCSSMIDYLNKHREYKHDLVKAEMTTYSDLTMVSNIFNGLPSQYNGVKE
jgi:hypothetical protein